MRLSFLRHVAAALALGQGLSPVMAHIVQTPVDRADPSVVEDQLRREQRTPLETKPAISITPPRGVTSEVGQSLVAGAIRVQGATSLPPSAFASVIAAYAGRTLGPKDLRALASDVADVARSAGFGLATAWVPPQRIASGIVTVMLDEGRIDEILIDGDAAIVRNVLAPLVGVPAVRTSELERQLLVAGDRAGVRIGKVRLERRGGRNVLIVKAARNRVASRVYLDNWGSSTVGPVRARFIVDFNGPFSGGDQLTLGGAVTPLQLEEFVLGHASYTMPVGLAGTEVSFGGYYAYSEPGGSLADRDFEGESMEVQTAISHPFVRSRSSSVWGSLDFRIRSSTQELDGAKTRSDHLTVVGGSLFATRQVTNGRVRARLAASRGLALFDATKGGDRLASRSDADGIFSKFGAWGEYRQGLGREFSLLFQAEGQFANRPLLSSEEMGLGGRYFGRAWDYREFSGDRGIAGSVELRYDLKDLPRPISTMQLYGYADGGKVSNCRRGSGGGSLASAGGGLRVWLPNGIEAGVEAAFPITNGSRSTKGKDPRFSFTVGLRF